MFMQERKRVWDVPCCGFTGNGPVLERIENSVFVLRFGQLKVSKQLIKYIDIEATIIFTLSDTILIFVF